MDLCKIRSGILPMLQRLGTLHAANAARLAAEPVYEDIEDPVKAAAYILSLL